LQCLPAKFHKWFTNTLFKRRIFKFYPRFAKALLSLVFIGAAPRRLRVFVGFARGFGLQMKRLLAP